MLEKIIFHFPIFDRSYNFNTEELTPLELGGRTAQKVNEIIDLINGWQGQLDAHELSDNITINRKLSPSGNFTGLLNGKAVTLVLSQVGDSADKISYLTSQFADGQTGLVIDGGFFEDTGIDKNYNGGRF